MKKNETSSAHTLGPWFVSPRICTGARSIRTDGGITHIGWASCRDDHNAPQTEAVTLANARLMAESPNLLRIAESAANAFKERISCLKDELLEDFCDVDDINDQIDNYQWLLDEHEKVIDQAKGKAA